jgi:serine/threonine protein phosphatase 1
MAEAATEGQRIYAIGDIHGRRDLLDLILKRVKDDLRARPHPSPHVVFLGDYVDRGPDSRGVIDKLLELARAPLQTTFLLGNHDSYLLGYLEDPEWSERSLHWFHGGMGGAATLASYGVHDVSDAEPQRSHAAFLASFPEDHAAFLYRCAYMEKIGGYLFVHAGVRPGVPLDKQVREDLLWIREPFLSSREDHGVKVVHGHTIVPYVEHRQNRIALDTGAVRTGILSCLVLEGDDVSLLTTAGPRPLPLGAGTGLDKVQRRLVESLRRWFPARRSEARQVEGRA